MASIGQDAAPWAFNPWSALKRSTVLALMVLTGVTIAVHEAYVLHPDAPQWTHLAPFKDWLIPHVAAGAVALLLGPLQFSTTIRRRNIALHRWFGRAYVGAALLSSVLALYIIAVFEAPSSRWVMGTMAALWLVTTAFAWFAALSHNIPQHQLWIARSYCFTFTFTLTRFGLDIVWPGLDHDGVTAFYWVLNVLCLIVPDIVLWTNALRRRLT